MAKADLTAQRLRELLHYDSETGLFTRAATGKPAGCVAPTGYISISVDGKDYLGHRLAWLYVHGEWPKQMIDHVNGVRNDNIFTNLRDVSSRVNGQNQRKPAARNGSGYLGVSWAEDRGKWTAQINIDGRVTKLGRFTSPEDAHAAYLAAKRKHHEGCTI